VNCCSAVPLPEVVENCLIDGPKVASVEFGSVLAQSESRLIKLRPGAKKSGIIVRKRITVRTR